jgi:hypothetical protein
MKTVLTDLATVAGALGFVALAITGLMVLLQHQQAASYAEDLVVPTSTTVSSTTTTRPLDLTTLGSPHGIRKLCGCVTYHSDQTDPPLTGPTVLAWVVHYHEKPAMMPSVCTGSKVHCTSLRDPRDRHVH